MKEIERMEQRSLQRCCVKNIKNRSDNRRVRLKFAIM